MIAACRMKGFFCFSKCVIVFKRQEPEMRSWVGVVCSFQWFFGPTFVRGKPNKCEENKLLPMSPESQIVSSQPQSEVHTPATIDGANPASHAGPSLIHHWRQSQMPNMSSLQ
jgi:hypothetical protein